MSDVDDTKRFDCFISFHGSQTLDSLSLPAHSRMRTVRHFAEYLAKTLRNHDSRAPSIFIDSSRLTDRIDEVFDAIMQLRGGGIALVLLTLDYFNSQYCLAELRSFLNLARLRDHHERWPEAITLRLFCLEPPHDGQSGVNCILDLVKRKSGGDHDLRPFVNGLDTHVIHQLCRRSTVEYTAQDIIDDIWDHWGGHSSRPSLGRTRKQSFLDMHRFFRLADKTNLARALGVDPLACEDAMAVSEMALKEGCISYRRVDALLEACRRCQNREDSENAIRAYQRKWCASGWLWTSHNKEHFQSYMHTASDLVLVQGVDPSTPSSPGANVDHGQDENALATAEYDYAMTEERDPDVICELADSMMRCTGGCGRNPAGAARLYERVISLQKKERAMLRLSQMLENGEGTAPNQRRARRLYQEAIELEQKAASAVDQAQASAEPNGVTPDPKVGSFRDGRSEGSKRRYDASVPSQNASQTLVPLPTMPTEEALSTESQDAAPSLEKLSVDVQTSSPSPEPASPSEVPNSRAGLLKTAKAPPFPPVYATFYDSLPWASLPPPPLQEKAAEVSASPVNLAPPDKSIQADLAGSVPAAERTVPDARRDTKSAESVEPPDSIFARAKKHERNGRLREAADLYLKAAMGGHLDAMVSYASHLKASDERAAFVWFRAAAERGSGWAWAELGQMLAEGKTFEVNAIDAARCWKRAATKGYAIGQSALGLCYIRGFGVKANAEKGLEMVKAVANGRNDVTAMKNLAWVYRHGKGVAADMQAAEYWDGRAREREKAQRQEKVVD